MVFVSDAIPVHSLPKTPSQVPALKIFRFKNSLDIQRNGPVQSGPVSLPITPLPTDTPHRHTYYEILFIEEGQGLPRNRFSFLQHSGSRTAFSDTRPGSFAHFFNFFPRLYRRVFGGFLYFLQSGQSLTFTAVVFPACTKAAYSSPFREPTSTISTTSSKIWSLTI
jgi:hypothetical protein